MHNLLDLRPYWKYPVVFQEGLQLYKANDVIGLPVMEIATGRRLGTVKDILICSEWYVRGLMLECRRWFSASRYIPVGQWLFLGEDAVTVGDKNAIVHLSDSADFMTLLAGNKKLKDLPVISEAGLALGTVQDVYFDEKMGNQIVSFELSDGFISDMREGRKQMRAPDNVTIGEDALIVPVQDDEDLEKIITLTNE